MKKIKLSQGKYAIVDDEDFIFLNRLSWQSHHTTTPTTAGEEHWHALMRIHSSFVGQTKKTRNKVTIYMEQFLIKVPNNYKIGHINGNTLDNRKENLRPTTSSKSLAYARKRITHNGKLTTSKYKGVALHKNKTNRKWAAIVTKDKKHYWLGYFYTPEEAALAYNVKALELYGEYAYQNNIEHE
jgi:hypothetical protein